MASPCGEGGSATRTAGVDSAPTTSDPDSGHTYASVYVRRASERPSGDTAPPVIISWPARPTGPPGVPVRVTRTVETLPSPTVAPFARGFTGRYTPLEPSTSFVTM